MATFTVDRNLNYIQLDGQSFGVVGMDGNVYSFDGVTIIGVWMAAAQKFIPNDAYSGYITGAASPTPYTGIGQPINGWSNDSSGNAATGGGWEPPALDDGTDNITPAPVMPIQGYTGAIPVPGSGVGFGDPRTGHTHAGVDLFASRGTPAVAIYAGKVISAKYNNGIGGNTVTIEDQWGNRYYYAHLDTISVKTGDIVTQGQTLGGVGDTGNAKGTGTHLHFAYYPGGGAAVNPHELLVGAVTGQGTGNPAEKYGNVAAPVDYTATNESIDDLFQEYLGRNASASEKSMIIGGGWSTDHVFRYIKTLPEWKNSPGYDALRVQVQDVWNSLVGTAPIPPGFLDDCINKGLTQLQVEDRIRKMAEYKNGREYKTTQLTLADQWETRTGRPMSDIAKLALGKAIDENWTMPMWDEFIESQPEFANGIETEGKKAFVLNILEGMWGYGAVQDKLALDPDYVKNVVWGAVGEGADANTIEQWARKQPEWINGPGASASRNDLRTQWGNVMRSPIDEEVLAEYVADGTTPDQLLDIMRQTPEYQARYSVKPPWLTEDEFNTWVDAYNSKGRVYFNNDDFAYSNAQIKYYFDHGITPDEVGDRYRFTEEGASELGNAPGTWGFYLEAMGVTLTQDMAYLIASGGEGSGKLKSLIIQGQNRRTFDTAFALYMGRAPGAGDYAYLENNFVSAQEYASRMKAKEDAIQMFPDVNEMFQRVYGYEADLQKLQDVAIGAEGSGAYQALIQAAEEMDRYTLPWREYARTDPTPQQYAEWSGFAGPSELEKLLRARELVKSQGREIMDVYNTYWTMQGAPGISEEDVFTLEGQYQGWGAIDARLTQASEHRQRQEQARSQWLGSPTAQAYTVVTQFGGPQTPFMRRPQG